MPWNDRIKHRLKLRDLDILMAVVRAGSMGKAARQLRIAQPAISKAIGELERTLGVRLFDRSRQGAQPTASGLALARHGTVVFDELRKSIADMDFLADPAAGEVLVGATEPIAAAIVAPLIDRLSRQHPRLAFRVLVGDNITLYRELEARNVEFVLSRVAGATGPQQSEEVLFDDPLVVVTGTRHQLARRRKIALTELMLEPWIMAPPGGYFGSYQAAVFQAGGLPLPRVAVTTASANLRYELLATGHFLTLMPSFSLRLPHRQSWLKILPVDLPDTRMPIAITTLRNRSLSRAAETFINAVREWVKPLSAPTRRDDLRPGRAVRRVTAS